LLFLLSQNYIFAAIRVAIEMLTSCRCSSFDDMLQMFGIYQCYLCISKFSLCSEISSP